jgi:hypothetical protein
MVSRRDVITAGAIGAFGAAPSTAASAPSEQSGQEAQAMQQVATAVKSVDSTLERAFLTNTLAHGFVGKLRANMETFFRGSAKFPDFMDIGIAVFLDIYDWHVRNQQQLVVTRAPDGRYWMQFMFSTLILRHEQDPGYIGPPYDKA